MPKTVDKWEVIFAFTSCTSRVEVFATTAESADKKAREQLWPHVPRSIPATIKKMGRGGARPGAGNKKGSKRVKNLRTIKRDILLTPSEDEEVKRRAKNAGMNEPDYRRMKILSGTK